MKKLFTSLLALSLLLVGCGGNSEDDGYEVALVTDAGTVTDKSFNQSAWEAVKAYGETSGKTYKYYQPQDTDKAGLKATIAEAIDNGAKVVVTPGFNFTEALMESQEEFPDVKFIAIDQSDLAPTSNTVSYMFAEAESGYLAGYAAVKEGYTNLGFMGGMAVDAVVNFGIGYIQGANDAAKELNTTVNVKYTYTGTFSESPEINTQAKAWYNAGTDVIFSCGGGICNSIFSAAEELNKATIGVDSDQHDLSDTVLTSALKGVTAAVREGLEAYGSDSFQGGKVITLDKAGDTAFPGRFANLTEADYTAVKGQIEAGSINLLTNKDLDSSNSAKDPSKLTWSNVTVSFE